MSNTDHTKKKRGWDHTKKTGVKPEVSKGKAVPVSTGIWSGGV